MCLLSEKALTGNLIQSHETILLKAGAMDQRGRLLSEKGLTGNLIQSVRKACSCTRIFEQRAEILAKISISIILDCTT